MGAGVCLTLPQSHQRLGLVASSAPPDEVGLFRVIKAALVAQTSEPCSGLEEVTVNRWQALSASLSLLSVSFYLFIFADRLLLYHLAGLKLMTLLSQPLDYWDYRRPPPHLVSCCSLTGLGHMVIGFHPFKGK